MRLRIVQWPVIGLLSLALLAGCGERPPEKPPRLATPTAVALLGTPPAETPDILEAPTGQETETPTEEESGETLGDEAAGAETIHAEEAPAEEMDGDEGTAEGGAVTAEDAAPDAAEEATGEAATTEAVDEGAAETAAERAATEESAGEMSTQESPAEEATPEAADSTEEAAAATPAATAGRGGGMGAGMGAGMGGGMGGNMMDPGLRDRHMATIPDAYAGLTSPIPADDDSLARAESNYTFYCASCHGPEAMGDGPAASVLDPAPPPISRTSRMMGDDYLFWRISEGGAMAPFNSAMPAWKDVLDEQARWDLINYIRSLGVGPDGMPMNAAAEAEMHAAMIEEGIAQGLFSQEEGDLYLSIHAAMEAVRATAEISPTGNMIEMQETFLGILLDQGEITQEEADTFVTVRDALIDADIMQ